MNSDRTQQLNTLQQAIRSCTRCVEAGYLLEANPIFQGCAKNHNMIIGQAPGPRAHLSGVPWSGASGTLLRTWFAKAGYDPEHFLEEWYFTSLTKCFPGKATSSSGDRPPSAGERALCRAHLDAEIQLIQPRLIVTLGRMATDAMIAEAKSLTLRELVGSAWTADLGYGPVPVLPLPHPSGVGRWLNEADNRALVDQALSQMGRLCRSLDIECDHARCPRPTGSLDTHVESKPR